MGIRDLGYRAYEGQRLPASHNVWVLLRHGFSRTWSPWLVRIWAFIGVITMGIAMAAMGIAFGAHAISNGQIPAPNSPAPFLNLYFTLEDWTVASVIAMRAGATVIAEDRTHRAYQFFLAKPVTSLQYLASRSLALSISLTIIIFVPAILVLTVYAVLQGWLGGDASQAIPGITEEPEALSVGLQIANGMWQVMTLSILSGVVLSMLSLGISTISRSRALTMSAFAGLFVVPAALGFMVDGLADTDWGTLGSIPGLLGVLRDGILEIGRPPPFMPEGAPPIPEQHAHWFHALPILAALCVGAGYLIWSRVRSVEVIT